MNEPLGPGAVKFVSWATAGLGPGAYTIATEQTVTGPQESPGSRTLSATKNFTVVDSRATPFQLPAGALHSYYPPDGENLSTPFLPHVVFSDPYIPWEQSPGESTSQLIGPVKIPWLALLVFTEEELATVPRSEPPIKLSSTLSAALSWRQLRELSNVQENNLRVHLGDGAANVDDDTELNVIFVDNDAFLGYFESQIDGEDGSRPNLGRYGYFAHVKRTASAGREQTFSVVMGHRTGRFDLGEPVRAYAHLVSLHGVGHHKTINNGEFTALVSLHSWTFAWVPEASQWPMLFVQKFVAETEGNIRPLRRSDAQLAAIKTLGGGGGEGETEQQDVVSTAWLRSRLAEGYTFVKHRLSTGETTMSLYRGPLMPNRPRSWASHSGQSGFHSASHQTIDPTAGFIDISYSVAWELGRSLAMANAAFTAALLRLRTKYISITREETRAPEGNKPKLPTWLLSLVNFSHTTEAAVTIPTGPSNASRWRNQANKTRTPDIPMPAHRGEDGWEAGRRWLQSEMKTLADRADGGGGGANEVTPLSVVFDFVHKELLSLEGVPQNYLIPEPDLLDASGVLTFFVDPAWLDALVDGALSLGNASSDADGGDRVKNEIKTVINMLFQNSSAKQREKRQHAFSVLQEPIPVWGLVVCGRLPHTFPDLEIRVGDAQNPTSDDINNYPRIVKLQSDAVLALFNSFPEQQVAAGLSRVVIAEPAHRQRFHGASTFYNWDNPGTAMVKIALNFVPSIYPAPSGDGGAGGGPPWARQPIPGIHDLSKTAVYNYWSGCINPWTLLGYIMNAANHGGDMYAGAPERGSSADLAVALAENLLELDLMIGNFTGVASGDGLSVPELFQLSVETEKDSSEWLQGGIQGLTGEMGDMRLLPQLGSSSGSLPLRFRVPKPRISRTEAPVLSAVAMMSPQKEEEEEEEEETTNLATTPKVTGKSRLVTSCHLLGGRAAVGDNEVSSEDDDDGEGEEEGEDEDDENSQDPETANFLIHIKAAREIIDNENGKDIVARLRICFPLGNGASDLVSSKTELPGVWAVGPSAPIWSVGAAAVTQWPLHESVGGGEWLLVDLKPEDEIHVARVDVSIVLSGVVRRRGASVAIESVEEYTSLRGGKSSTVTARTVVRPTHS